MNKQAGIYRNEWYPQFIEVYMENLIEYSIPDNTGKDMVCGIICGIMAMTGAKLDMVKEIIRPYIPVKYFPEEF
jgi:hypothetical protein